MALGVLFCSTVLGACVKKLLKGMMLTCAAVATPVMAGTVTYACQYLKSAGLDWQNDRWVSTGFYPEEPFMLIAIDGELVPPTSNDSSNPLSFTECKPPFVAPMGEPGSTAVSRVQSCSDRAGNSLVFNLNYLTGAYSQIIGGASSRNQAYKDTLSVSPFVCEKIR